MVDRTLGAVTPPTYSPTPFDRGGAIGETVPGFNEAMKAAEQIAASGTPGIVPNDEKLRKATRQFEAYFVGTLLKQMHASASKGGLFGQKSDAALYREMFDDAVAKKIGDKGAFGIGDIVYKRTARMLAGSGEPEPQGTPPIPGLAKSAIKSVAKPDKASEPLQSK